jgi:DNA-binding NarL/FixJ family response regulator
LADAKAHAPIERQAQRIANSRIQAMKNDNPDMDKDEIKKRSQQELSEARAKLGGKRSRMEITDAEWTAIQAGAITDNKLKDIVEVVGADNLRERALPKTNKGLSSSKQSMIKTWSKNGYTNEEIASRLGVSLSTVNKYL